MDFPSAVWPPSDGSDAPDSTWELGGTDPPSASGPVSLVPSIGGRFRDDIYPDTESGRTMAYRYLWSQWEVVRPYDEPTGTVPLPATRSPLNLGNGTKPTKKARKVARKFARFVTPCAPSQENATYLNACRDLYIYTHTFAIPANEHKQVAVRTPSSRKETMMQCNAM